ncbi:MAG: SAVED domain-containing protein [Thermodesulfovibrionales bacterium]
MLWELLDRLNIITGIIVSIPVVWSWWILITQKRRQKELIKSLEFLKGNRPVAIIVDIGPGNSVEQVKFFLKDSNMDMEVLQYSIDELQPDKIQDFVVKLQQLKASAMERGSDRIHLFYRGPVAGALITGEVFSNIAVTIYHFNKSKGTYESWGPLHRSFL